MIPKLKKDLVLSYEKWKDRTPLTVNEISLSEIDASVEEEVLGISIAQTEDDGVEEEVLHIGTSHTEDDACPAADVWKSE